MKILYASVNSCDPVGERNLIVSSVISRQCEMTEMITFQRVSQGVAEMIMPRSGLVRALRELNKVDTALRFATSPLMVHHNLYGQDEYAHSPIGRNYVSFNIGVARVRTLFIGSLLGDTNAQAALVDLFIHEKAHLVRQWEGDRCTEHDFTFYRYKERIKEAFLRSDVDPFELPVSKKMATIPTPTRFVRKSRSIGVGVGFAGQGFGGGI